MTYNLIKGSVHNPSAKIAIVVAEFNHFVTDSLLKGAISTLEYTGGISPENVTVVKVPGAFEIPFAIKDLALTGKFDGIIALGAVIRGATPHFDYVCGPMASAIMNLQLELNLPISFGVLTTNDLEETFERAGTKAGNKGSEAAHVALEMISLRQKIKG